MLLNYFCQQYHHGSLKGSDYTSDLIQHMQLISSFMTEVPIMLKPVQTNQWTGFYIIRSHNQGPGSRVTGEGSRVSPMGPGSRVPTEESQVAGPGSHVQVSGPEFRIPGPTFPVCCLRPATILKKEIPIQVFSFEFWEVFEKSFFLKHLRQLHLFLKQNRITSK